jgi:hypothetical protein
MVPFQNMKVDFSKKITHEYSALSQKVALCNFFDHLNFLFFTNHLVCFFDGYIRQIIDDLFDVFN